MVYYEKKKSLALITLKSADSKSIINTQMAAELEAIRNRIHANNDIRAVIVTGEGTFSAGVDLEEFSQSEDKTELLGRLCVTPFLS